MTHNKIRDKFLSFFKSKDHVIVESSDLVDKSDPSVLLTTAGMQQFKPYYSGAKDPEKDFSSRRVVSVQKCFRTSDIEEVGDKDHLTFLEMLGNFSFGDYYKKEAMEFAWEFLTGKLGIPQEKLWVTIFAGEEGIPKDQEAHQIANGLGVPDGRIATAGREDNFWGLRVMRVPAVRRPRFIMILQVHPAEKAAGLIVKNATVLWRCGIWSLTNTTRIKRET